MDKQHGTRRWILGSLVGLVPAVAALGHGASAERKPRDEDYPSKAAFKLECELLGGTFSEGSDGIACNIPGVGSVHCDANAKNCESDTTWQGPSGGATSYDGSVNQVAFDDQGPTAKLNRKRGKQGKKNRRGGRRRT
jgi:hypothetical protein